MLGYLRYGIALAVLVAVAPPAESALSVDVARRCQAATARAFPSQQIGNPAARPGGQREYFNRCVARGNKRGT